MPQTTTAINTVDGLIEVSANGTTWTNISGSSNKVVISPQTADEGDVATLEGQYKIPRSGKYNPVEATVTILLTETAAEAFAMLYAQKEVAGKPLYMRITPGGYDGVYRWYTADANGNKAPGRISAFPYPGVDATEAAPALLEFKLRAIQFARENNQPSPSASVSPSASSSA